MGHSHPINRVAWCLALTQPSDPDKEDNLERDLNMINTKLSRGERSRAHVLMLQALDAPFEHPTNAQDAASAALAEAISFHSDGVHFSLGELFSLADAVLFHRDDHCGIGAPATYDLDSLIEVVGNRDLARLAISLCGAHLDPQSKTWKDGTGPTKHVEFGGDFYEWRAMPR